VSTRSETQLKQAFEAFTQGDAGSLIELLRDDAQVVSLERPLEKAHAYVRRGQSGLEEALKDCLTAGRPSKVQDVVRRGDHAMVVMHTPGLGAAPASYANPLRFYVLTMRDDRIASIRACESRGEAVALAQFA